MTVRLFLGHPLANPEDIMKFTSNVGSIDRVLRIVLGLALIAGAVQGALAPWGWIGAILVITAFIKFCPIYAVTGLSSLKTK